MRPNRILMYFQFQLRLLHNMYRRRNLEVTFFFNRAILNNIRFYFLLFSCKKFKKPFDFQLLFLKQKYFDVINIPFSILKKNRFKLYFLRNDGQIQKKKWLCYFKISATKPSYFPDISRPFPVHMFLVPSMKSNHCMLCFISFKNMDFRVCTVWSQIKDRYENGIIFKRNRFLKHIMA